MTYDELRVLGASVYGKRWRRPLARALGCDKRLIHFFQTGERKISPAFAAGVRAKAVEDGLSGAALFVRAVLTDAIPKAAHSEVHRAAKLVILDLERRGMLKK